jgi:menaquinone-dependent protoporphyrinogen IX oxidase
MARTLVAYYSRTGTTRRVAIDVAHALDADLEEIRDRRDRAGPAGFVRSLLEASLQVGSDIDPPRHVPGAYELVVIGSPAWGPWLSSPARSFIWRHRADLEKVAFFSTTRQRGAEAVLEQMAHAAGKAPEAVLALHAGDVWRNRAAHAIERFVDRIRSVLEEEHPRNGPAPAPH